MAIERINQVWSTDSTYIRLRHGFVYVVAVLDWFSRSVLSWELSISLDTSFCLQALDRALQVAIPAIFKTEEASTMYQSRLYQTVRGRPDPHQSRWQRARI